MYFKRRKGIVTRIVHRYNQSLRSTMVCIIDRHREYEWEDRKDARMYEKSYYISVDPGGNDAIELNSPDLT